MIDQVQRIQLAEELGFSAVWLRDVPFNVPSFGDAGQLHDPFVYLGLLAGRTRKIALGVASIVLPLRHPAHVAKAASSVDALSGGRLILGVASGDRPEEYPALNQPFDDRGKRFRDSFDYIRLMGEYRPEFKVSKLQNGLRKTAMVGCFILVMRNYRHWSSINGGSNSKRRVDRTNQLWSPFI